MKIGRLLARIAQPGWVKPILRTATPVGLQFWPFILHIDEPHTGVVEKSVDTIQGWFLAPLRTGEISLRLAGVRLTSVEVERGDAKQIFGHYVRGFRAIADIDAVAMKSSVIADSVGLELVVNGTLVASRPLRLLNCDAASARASARKRAQKREWLKAKLACPRCESDTRSLEFMDQKIRCGSCGSSFNDDGKMFNFLPEEFKRDFNIDDWENISAHPYDDVAIEIIEEVRRKGGKVLDCGSGLRSEVDETVVYLEIASFPNVDILGVNQRLPIRDAVFDAILSLNVLEHVTDPFACAVELIRVLKPGGTLYCCIPFLQPEHGYPNHYFNATRSGLRQLFARRLDLVRHFVPASGEPIWALHWFLSWYLRELPAPDRAEFLNMRVEDLLASRPLESLQKPWVAHLSENGKYRLASSTAAIFRKPVNSIND